jgi:hypothetical protein
VKENLALVHGATSAPFTLEAYMPIDSALGLSTSHRSCLLNAAIAVIQDQI